MGPLYSEAQLDVIPIGTTDNTNPLDLVDVVEVEVVPAFEFKLANPFLVGEGDVLPLIGELPPTDFVFDRARVLFKLRIALFSHYLQLAVGIEPINR